MSNYIEQITELQKKVESSKLEQAKLQERAKSLTEEKKSLLTELFVYEVEELDLDKEIRKLEDSIQTELAKCEELLK